MAAIGVHGGVVVGVDGSSASMAAVEWAARDAAIRKVPLTVVHVSLQPVLTTWPEVPGPGGVQQRQGAEERHIIDSAVAVARGATPGQPTKVESELVTGVPVECLVDSSKTARLLVVGHWTPPHP